MSSSAHLGDSAPGAVRPRNRRLPGAIQATATSTSTSLLSSGNPSPAASRGVSPVPAARLRRDNGQGTSSPHGKGLLDAGWAPSWASVQGFASSFFSGGGTYGSDTEVTAGQSSSRRRPSLRRSGNGSARKLPDTWGPAPPSTTRIGIDDVGAGTLADREAELRARRTASVLESHPGVNGGLDVLGNLKRRKSDENLSDGGRAHEVQDQLVYIHHVQKTDTYVGIVLKYKCREDAFKKANGLWSRDNIQIRRWLVLPVDACEIRGRPCDGPSFYAQDVDLLAPTPQPSQHSTTDAEDFFSASSNGKGPEPPKPSEEEKPWTHVRWVKIDSISSPVEVARISRKAIGYFPPRRKKSLHTTSTLSTPRQSLDASVTALSDSYLESPGSVASRRYSTIAGRTHVATAYGVSTPPSSRSRVGSVGDDLRPGWMRGPGGVGSLSRHVRVPGPERDYLNAWAKKHLPGLNIESLPSMSVMGSETAHFGFDAGAASLVESPFAEGHDAASMSRQGSGLDKAAATLETWLRGAWARRPSTPILGAKTGRQQDDWLGDLIELEDTNSDDGRLGPGGLSLLSPEVSRSGRSEGDGAARSRSLPAASLLKGKKAD